MQTEFDGKIQHQPPVVGPGWVDEWWGPGGHLIVGQISRSAPIRRLDGPHSRPVDHLETLYRPDGTTVQYAGGEGDEYQALAELFGPELWEKRNAA